MLHFNYCSLFNQKLLTKKLLNKTLFFKYHIHLIEPILAESFIYVK